MDPSTERGTLFLLRGHVSLLAYVVFRISNGNLWPVFCNHIDCALIKYPHINSLPFAYIVAVLPYPVDGTFGVFPSMYIFCLLYLFPSSNVLWSCIPYVVCLLLSSASHCFTGGLGLVRVGCLLVLFGWARVLHCVHMIGGLLYMFPAFLGCVFFFFFFFNCGNRLSRCGVSRLLLFYIYTYILSSLSFLLDENHRKIRLLWIREGLVEFGILIFAVFLTKEGC